MLFWAVAATCVHFSSLVLAQSAAVVAATSAPKPLELPNVIVTAEKRETSAQATPVSITVAEASLLQDNGIYDLTRLTDFVPNVEIVRNTTGVGIAIRGIASFTDTPLGNRSAGFYIDGVSFGRAQGAAAPLFDVERIEVLRGPQGTLYGRNTISGTVNVVTKKPTDQFEGTTNVGFGNYGDLHFDSALNTPVNPWLRLRFAYQFGQDDGYVEAKDPARNIRENSARTDYRAGRFHALIQPNKTFSLLLTGNARKDKGSAASYVFRPKDGSAPSRVSVTGVANSNQSVFRGVSAELKVNIPGAQLVYEGGYHAMNQDEHQPFYSGGANVDFESHHVQNEQSHDLRLVSVSTGRLVWVAGAYNYLEHIRSNAFVAVAGLGFFSPYILNKSQAAYGQATYRLVPRLRIIAGARGTEDRKVNYGGTWAVNALGQPTRLLAPSLGDRTWRAVNWKTGVEWDVRPGSLAYATISTGYRGGGIFDGVGAVYYDPETLTAFEIGLKNRFLQNRLQVNLSLFHYNYHDFQVSSVEVSAITGQPSTITRNIPSVPIDGGELETTYRLGRDDRIDFNLSALSSEFGPFSYGVQSPTTRQVVVRNLAGNELPLAAKWNTRLSYAHVFPLSNGATITGQMNFRWCSGYYISFDNHPIPPFPRSTFQPAFTKSDVLLTYRMARQRWELGVFVRNLEDDIVLASPSGNVSGEIATLTPPRTYGVRLGLNY